MLFPSPCFPKLEFLIFLLEIKMALCFHLTDNMTTQYTPALLFVELH